MTSERDPVLMAAAQVEFAKHASTRGDTRSCTELMHDFAQEQRRELGEEIAREFERRRYSPRDGWYEAAIIARTLSQARTNTNTGTSPKPADSGAVHTAAAGARGDVPDSPAAELLREVVEALTEEGNYIHEVHDAGSLPLEQHNRVARALTAAREWIQAESSRRAALGVGLEDVVSALMRVAPFRDGHETGSTGLVRRADVEQVMRALFAGRSK